MERQLFTDRVQDFKSQSLSKVVEEQLEQMILNGELQPGERINESYLSNTLKISRAPIREACRQLAQYGMVENRIGKGTYVRLVNLEEAVELYELRGVLDALAAEKASLLASSEAIAGLEQLVEQMRNFAARHEATEYFATNLKFHHQIVQLADSASLIVLYEVVFKKLSLFRQKTLSRPDRLQRSLSQHEGIFGAIKDRNPQLASQLARSHVEEAKEVLLAAKV